MSMLFKHVARLFAGESRVSARALQVQTRIKAGRRGRGRGKDDGPNHR